MVGPAIEGAGLDLSKLSVGSVTEFKRLELQAMKFFEEICEIPRKSGYTTEIVQYLRDFADKRGLKHDSNSYEHTEGTETYKGENIWIDLPATKGCEGYPPVILQAHTDMVAEKIVDHDFEKDKIEMLRDGDKVTANGTTLGADNGAGIAIMLALAESNEPHGPIRLLFTGDEEVDFVGARHLDKDVINADIIINLDTENVDEIVYSCAGSVSVKYNQSYDTFPIEDGEIVCKMSLEKLQGGHTGQDINKKELLHGNVTMIDILDAFQENQIPFKFSGIQFGSAKNAIPAASSAEIVIPADKFQEAKEIFDTIVKAELYKHPQEVNMESSFIEEAKEGKQSLSKETTSKIMDLFLELPQGVLRKSDEDRSVVETSAYTGKVVLEGGDLSLDIFARSSDSTQIYLMQDDYQTISDKYGLERDISFSLPWEGEAKAEIVQFALKYFKEGTGIEPKAVAIHAGLECSEFANRKKGLRIISMGPTTTGVHSTDETLYASTVGICAAALRSMLKNVDKLSH